jgi:4-hydroxy-4-methyl-2-oxoglutarate aldolase
MSDAASGHELNALRRLDGVAVANALETFELRLRNEGFADGSIACLTPDLPPAVGYAATARVRCSSPPPVGHLYADRTDWWNYIVTVPQPRFVVIEDIDDHRGLGAFIGDVHANILRALGCVGYATNGAVRDVAKVRAIPFSLFAASIAVSHAFAHIVDCGQPVTIGGLQVSSGDLLFGDAHGVQSIPPPALADLPRAAAELDAKETEVIALCQSPGFSIEALRALLRRLE